MENGDIPDGNIGASAQFSGDPAYEGRLNAHSYWGVPYSAHQPWIQVDIGYQTYVSGVATQGHGSMWVASFKVSTFYMTIANDETFVSEDGVVAKVNNFLH